MLLCCSRNSLQIQFSSFSSLLLFGKREEGVIEFFQDFTFSENLCHLQTFFRGFSNARMKVLIKLPFMIFLKASSNEQIFFRLHIPYFWLGFVFLKGVENRLGLG